MIAIVIANNTKTAHELEVLRTNEAQCARRARTQQI